jgi:hypothetical protein
MVMAAGEDYMEAIPSSHSPASSAALRFHLSGRFRRCVPKLPNNPAKGAQKNIVTSMAICLSACVTATTPPSNGWLKTVGSIVEEVPWHPERTVRKGAEKVGVRIEFREVSLQQQVKRAGGRWNPARRVWELRRNQALKLGLKDRIEKAQASIGRNLDSNLINGSITMRLS